MGAISSIMATATVTAKDQRPRTTTDFLQLQLAAAARWARFTLAETETQRCSNNPEKDHTNAAGLDQH